MIDNRKRLKGKLLLPIGQFAVGKSVIVDEIRWILSESFEDTKDDWVKLLQVSSIQDIKKKSSLVSDSRLWDFIMQKEHTEIEKLRAEGKDTPSLNHEHAKYRGQPYHKHEEGEKIEDFLIRNNEMIKSMHALWATGVKSILSKPGIHIAELGLGGGGRLDVSCNTFADGLLNGTIDDSWFNPEHVLGIIYPFASENIRHRLNDQQVLWGSIQEGSQSHKRDQSVMALSAQRDFPTSYLREIIRDRHIPLVEIENDGAEKFIFKLRKQVCGLLRPVLPHLDEQRIIAENFLPDSPFYREIIGEGRWEYSRGGERRM